MFFPLLFPPVLQSSLLGLEPGQNPCCLASGSNEAQALDVSLQKFTETHRQVRGGFVQTRRKTHF